MTPDNPGSVNPGNIDWERFDETIRVICESAEPLRIYTIDDVVAEISRENLKQR